MCRSWAALRGRAGPLGADPDISPLDRNPLDVFGFPDEEKIKEVQDLERQAEEFSHDEMLSRVIDRRLGRQEAGVPMGPPGR